MVLVFQQMLESGNIQRLLVSILVGGLIGMERELRDKAAGFRTMILICTGANLFTVFSIGMAENSDPTRIAANIVSGIGFLGAGVIIQQSGQIKGLTTATTIWLVAALGMGIGAGYSYFVLYATVIILVVLWGFPWLERWMEAVSEVRTYQITIPNNPESYAQVDDLWKEYNLQVFSRKTHKEGDERVCTWRVTGRPSKHEAVVAILLNNADVHELSY
ncbi:MAG: MgtC/SapB family protein [Anaerolineaceae bacterium]|jgi:putative Mg2+ transporter-C (MgtC) family protein|nr:MgtC/SapB family protein [Anaerolineaceae bacterium]